MKRILLPAILLMALLVPTIGNARQQPREPLRTIPAIGIGTGDSAGKLAGLMPNGWYFPTGSLTFATGGFCRWFCYNPDFNGWHLAQDITNPQGSPVFAIGDGEVVRSSTSVSNYGPNGTNGGAVVVRHRAADGTEFLALYGHINNPRPLGPVCAGDVLGTSNAWNPPHVHFGIHPGADVPSNPYRGYTRNQSRNYGWTDPLPFLDAHPRAAGGSSVGFRPNGQAPRHPDGALLRTAGDPTVYLIENGLRRGIVSESVLANLYSNGGFSADDVILVSGEEMSSYSSGSIVSATLPSNGRSQPPGRLIKAPSSGEISVVSSSGVRRPFASSAVFTGLGYSFCRVREIGDYNSYPVGQIVTGVETTPGDGDGDGNASVTPLQSGVPVSGVLALDEWRHYSIEVPSDARELVVTLSGSGDPDLYTRRGSRPTFDSWDCRPYVGGPNEECRYSSPAPGTWFVSVHGFSGGSNFTVTARVETGSVPGWQTVMSEGAEYGANGWSTSSNVSGNFWVIQAAEPHSGLYRFSSGNGVNAIDNLDQSLWSPMVDLRGVSNVELSYFVTYDLEQNYDWFLVEVSTDGGATFSEVSRVSGMSAGTTAQDHVWAPKVTVDLSGFAGSQWTVFRFRLVTDTSVTSWGVVLDDLQVRVR